MLRYRRLLLLLLLLICITDCCAPQSDKANSKTEDTRPRYQVTGQEGSIIGRVKFIGVAPPVTPLQFDADNYCLEHAQLQSSETLLITDGELANVLVSIKRGPALNFSYAPPDEPALLDQRGCRYQPHIQGIMTGQRLKIVNSDDTDHNVQLLPKSAPPVSETQPRQSAPVWQQFTRAEIIPVSCKLHPWMRAYLGVFEHPFYAVAAADGSFQIKGLPPGEYQVAAWHERLGTQTATVNIAANATVSIEFSYQATADDQH